jgi:hypothetical protein
MGKQKCKKCKNELPKTNEFFTWDNKTQGVFKKICKPCFHEIAKGYREKHKKKKEGMLENALFDIAETEEREKAKLFYKALSTIHFNAFDKPLSKEEYEKLNIVK